MLTRHEAIQVLMEYPYAIGHKLGFTKLTSLHNSWIKDMVRGNEDATLQAHRGSYKTTCVSLALANIILLMPDVHTMFMRKTDTDTKEVITQVKKILSSPQMQVLSNAIWNTDLRFDSSNATSITTNLCQDIKGTVQLYAMGVGGSITGKHFDRIFTDDIINVEDRKSRAAREQTKLIYQELQNIKNRGGRIYNTGTPWHKDDAFSLMPNVQKYDCYSTGLINSEDLETIKSSMTNSLFSANYELKHIADDDVIFASPNTNADASLAEQGISHIDAAYGGEDSTAFTVCKKKDGKYYIFGKIWHKHIDDVEDEIIALHKRFNCGKMYCENNGDKGYLAKDLRNKGMSVVNYHEDTNKYFKITSYLKAVWKDVIFVAGTDESYIDQICDYNENAEHDDAPDSAASAVRVLWKKNDNAYNPIYL